jgi:hypothetical protein
MAAMKQILAGLALISLGILTSKAFIGPSTQASLSAAATRTPVVVELFTSEGCSSCPPADALLSRLTEQQFYESAQLITLEEHVDYWDAQGWADPFSSRDWTYRQNVYSGVLGNRNPYTPQMVVDGTVEFNGSYAQKARQAILEAAGKTKIPVTLVQGSTNETGRGNFSVKVGKLGGTTKGDGAEVWLAITETGLHSAVKRGENAGQDLHHAAVVRSMHKIGEAKADVETAFAGDARVPLQKEWKRENLRAVLLVQEKKSRRILGAAETRISQ